jgi:hypothetical protein
VNKLIAPLSRTARKYLIDRGLTPSNEVSIFMKNSHGKGIISSERIGFPIFDINSKLIGYSKRQLFDNPQYPKYLLDRGVDKDRALYNHHLLQSRPKKIVIVEGQIDALLATQNLRVPVLAVLGSSLSRHHVESMIEYGVESVLVVGDNDKAGRKFAFGACDLLSKHDIFPSIGKIKGGYKDFGELKRFSWSDIEILDYWEELIRYAHFPEVGQGFNPRRKVEVFEKLEAINWRGAGLKVLEVIGTSSKKIATQVITKYMDKILELEEGVKRSLSGVERYRTKGFDHEAMTSEESELFFKFAVL